MRASSGRESEVAMRCRMTSVSDEVLKMDPCASRRLRSAW
uniref:Amidophosphoribosyltransferase n=1 Tax=Arundo donax TaxID=35708 RepID=A0A0A9FD25_ARUDO